MNDDDLRGLFPVIVPLESPPGTFERITRTVARRRRVRTATATVATTALMLVALVGMRIFLWPDGDVHPGPAGAPGATAAGPTAAALVPRPHASSAPSGYRYRHAR